MSDRSRDPAQRFAAAEQISSIRDTSDPQAVAETMHRILWSDAQPTDLRLLAMDRLIEYDADAFWRSAEQKILLVDLWPVLEPLIEKSVVRGDPSFTPALVRSYARGARIIPDAERPERDAILALNPGKTVEETVWQVCVDKPGALLLATRVDAWTLINRLAGEDQVRAWLMSTAASNDSLILDLQSASWLGHLPGNREGVLRLMQLRAETNRVFWKDASDRAMALTPEQRQGLELRHLGALRQANMKQLALDRSQLLSRVIHRLPDHPGAVRTQAGVMRQLPGESLGEHAETLCWADLLAIDLLLDAMSDPVLVRGLFRQADVDLADTTTEHGGVLDKVDGRFVAEPFLPVIRAHDQKFYSSDALIQRMYTGLFHYHFHAQKYMNAEYAGPGAGDLAFVANLQASAVVFTFLDQNTLGVDYYQPGGIVIDLGVIRR
ncbi:MAG: hypothetical protein R3C45_05210 [Phycisphaerales bacterium]